MHGDQHTQSVKPPEDDPSLLEVLGPGLVTGAADDDPSGIGTYSQVGAQFGYGMAWTMFFGFPLLAAIQAICARIGATTGRGIAQNLRRHYPLPLLQGAVLLLLLANIINLGADLGAMGAALALILPGPALAYTATFGVLSVLLEVFLSYDRYARILKWTTLSLFAYVGVVFVADVPLDEAVRGTLIPQFQFDREHAMALVAVFGTTISPYLFFWQAGQEVEEQHRRHIKPLHVSPSSRARRELRRIRTDTLVGMGFSHIVALFIIIATAATLHAHGVRDIESAAQAAEALRPIAGDLTFALFAIGIIGTGLLAVPILAGSAAYALSEAFGWVEGLDRKPREAKAFYGAIAAATLGGVALNFLSIDPMRALYLAAVVNGLLAPPLMVVTMLIAGNRKVMGKLAVRGRLAAAGWLSTAVMWVIAGVFLLS
ncbi:Nramp family divalent metal transporter [Altererythrobacter fulvus]|uniref:Nramp family divalent metal transporter n=1 Tax=Caenibius fulvus TaxID=2126012 RepID=UPI003016AD15